MSVHRGKAQLYARRSVFSSSKKKKRIHITCLVKFNYWLLRVGIEFFANSNFKIEYVTYSARSFICITLLFNVWNVITLSSLKIKKTFQDYCRDMIIINIFIRHRFRLWHCVHSFRCKTAFHSLSIYVRRIPNRIQYLYIEFDRFEYFFMYNKALSNIDSKSFV